MDAAEELARQHRAHWGVLLGRLLGRFGRIDLAEDALGEAYRQALEKWPSAQPENPTGWLAMVATRRILDELRREQVRHRRLGELAPPAYTPQPVPELIDERLRLLWLACHPALAPEVRPALALRFVLGVSTERIAELFLVPTATLAARLTRAKKRIAAAGFDLTMTGYEWRPRSEDAARSILLAYTAGYLNHPADHGPGSGQAEAVELAGLAARLLPSVPVLQALAALLTLQHARRFARAGSQGELVLLADQDRSLWSRDELADGLRRFAALEPAVGYVEELRLAAAAAALHAVASSAATTDWDRIAAIYARLEQLAPSPIVRLNRAAALAQAGHREAGRAVLEPLVDLLPGHQRLQSIRAEILRTEHISEHRPDPTR